jgi:hypothetical protein
MRCHDCPESRPAPRDAGRWDERGGGAANTAAGSRACVPSTRAGSCGAANAAPQANASAVVVERAVNPARGCLHAFIANPP